MILLLLFVVDYNAYFCCAIVNLSFRNILICAYKLSTCAYNLYLSIYNSILTLTN